MNQHQLVMQIYNKNVHNFNYLIKKWKNRKALKIDTGEFGQNYKMITINKQFN